MIEFSVWRSSAGTGKRLGLDWTVTGKDRNSQDWKRLQPQSGLQSVAISKNPGPTEDQSGPVLEVSSVCSLLINNH